MSASIFAGESSGVLELVLNKIEVSSRLKKHNRNELGLLVKCTNTTHSSCFTSFWYNSVPIQVSTVMEVRKKASESMNMFSGNSSKKKNLINLLPDDPHMTYTRTDEKVIELLSIEHQPHKGHRSSDRSKDKWDENYTEFKACDGMPAKGTKEYTWRQTQFSSGPFGLDAKIKK